MDNYRLNPCVEAKKTSRYIEKGFPSISDDIVSLVAQKQSVHELKDISFVVQKKTSKRFSSKWKKKFIFVKNGYIEICGSKSEENTKKAKQISFSKIFACVELEASTDLKEKANATLYELRFVPFSKDSDIPIPKVFKIDHSAPEHKQFASCLNSRILLNIAKNVLVPLSNENKERMDLCLKCDGDINAFYSSEVHKTPIMLAWENKNWDLVEQLSTKFANYGNLLNREFLEKSADYPRLINLLLQNKIDINCVAGDGSGMTVFHHLIRDFIINEKAHSLEFFIDVLNHCNPEKEAFSVVSSCLNEQNSEGENILLYTLSMCIEYKIKEEYDVLFDKFLVSLVLDTPIDIFCENNTGQNFLHLSVLSGRYSFVMNIVKSPFQNNNIKFKWNNILVLFDKKDLKGDNVFHVSARTGNNGRKFLSLFLQVAQQTEFEVDSSLNAQNFDKNTPLSLSIMYGNEDFSIRVLKELGPKTDITLGRIQVESAQNLHLDNLIHISLKLSLDKFLLCMFNDFSESKLKDLFYAYDTENNSCVQLCLYGIVPLLRSRTLSGENNDEVIRENNRYSLLKTIVSSKLFHFRRDAGMIFDEIMLVISNEFPLNILESIINALSDNILTSAMILKCLLALIHRMKNLMLNPLYEFQQEKLFVFDNLVNKLDRSKVSKHEASDINMLQEVWMSACSASTNYFVNSLLLKDSHLTRIENNEGNDCLAQSVISNSLGIFNYLIAYFIKNKFSFLSTNQKGDGFIHLIAHFSRQEFLLSLENTLTQDQIEDLFELCLTHNVYGKSAFHIALKTQNFKVFSSLASLFHKKFDLKIRPETIYSMDGFNLYDMCLNHHLFSAFEFLVDLCGVPLLFLTNKSKNQTGDYIQGYQRFEMIWEILSKDHVPQSFKSLVETIHMKLGPMSDGALTSQQLKCKETFSSIKNAIISLEEQAISKTEQEISPTGDDYLDSSPQGQEVIGKGISGTKSTLTYQNQDQSGKKFFVSYIDVIEKIKLEVTIKAHAWLTTHEGVEYVLKNVSEDCDEVRVKQAYVTAQVTRALKIKTHKTAYKSFGNAIEK